MELSTRELVLLHWQTANTRSWPQFAALLHPELVYDVPQTREIIRSAEGYVDMFETWPQPWRAEIEHLVAEASKAVCVIRFVTDTETMTGISIFEIRDQRIARVTDYWPSAYEPPPRMSRFIERGAAGADGAGG